MMNLANKSNLHRDNTASNIRELQQLIDKSVTVIMCDTNVDIEIAACEKMWDLPYHIFKTKMFSEPLDKSKFMLLQVKIADPSNLPYKLDGGEEVFVVYDEQDFCRFTNTSSAGRSIEQTFDTHSGANIDVDFLVMIGRELPVRTLNVMLARANSFMEE